VNHDRARCSPHRIGPYTNLSRSPHPIQDQRNRTMRGSARSRHRTCPRPRRSPGFGPSTPSVRLLCSSSLEKMRRSPWAGSGASNQSPGRTRKTSCSVTAISTSSSTRGNTGPARSSWPSGAAGTPSSQGRPRAGGPSWRQRQRLVGPRGVGKRPMALHPVLTGGGGKASPGSEPARRGGGVTAPWLRPWAGVRPPRVRSPGPGKGSVRTLQVIFPESSVLRVLVIEGRDITENLSGHNSSRHDLPSRRRT